MNETLRRRREDHNRPVFRREITVGNVLSIFSAIVAVAFAWHELDKSLALLAARVERIEVQLRGQGTADDGRTLAPSLARGYRDRELERRAP